MTRLKRSAFSFPALAVALTFAAALPVVYAMLARAPFAPVAHADPSAIKYTGAGSCDASQCHGAPASKPAPQFASDIGHNEHSIWTKLDKHSIAFRSKTNKKIGLVNDLSKAIAKELKIDKPEESQRCLVCHSLSGFSNGASKTRVALNVAQDVVAADVAAKKFSVSHGVSCDGCHGPSEKYLAPHVEKGWSAKQRVAIGSEKLSEQFGLYDTKNLKMRANMCVSCHLKIDSELIKAGHPELPFELDSFGHGDWTHWKTGGNFEGVRAWMLGQFVSMREAALQLNERVKSDPKDSAGLNKDSYKQLIAHALLARHPAKLVAPELEAEISKNIAAVNENWPDPAKLDPALVALAKTADTLAEKFNTQSIDKTFAETLVKNVAAEGEVAGTKGYRSAQQYAYAVGSLWEAVFFEGAAPPPDRRALDEKTKDDPKTQAITEVFSALLEPQEYKAATFNAAAKKLVAMFPGGVGLPLPPNAPDVPKQVAVAPPVVPPVAPPVINPQAPKKLPEHIFCPECGRKYPYAFRYCPDDGHALPRFNE